MPVMMRFFSLLCPVNRFLTCVVIDECTFLIVNNPMSPALQSPWSDSARRTSKSLSSPLPAEVRSGVEQDEDGKDGDVEDEGEDDADDDDFDDDFDDFEAGAGDADFDDFEDGFQQAEQTPAPAPPPVAAAPPVTLPFVRLLYCQPNLPFLIFSPAYTGL
jgi:hypothetical protein